MKLLLSPTIPKKLCNINEPQHEIIEPPIEPQNEIIEPLIEQNEPQINPQNELIEPQNETPIEPLNEPQNETPTENIPVTFNVIVRKCQNCEVEFHQGSAFSRHVNSMIKCDHCPQYFCGKRAKADQKRHHKKGKAFGRY